MFRPGILARVALFVKPLAKKQWDIEYEREDPTIGNDRLNKNVKL